MTTVVVARHAPYPPRSGSPLRTWLTIRALARLGPVHVFSVGGDAAAASMPGVERWVHVDDGEYPGTAHGGLHRLEKLLRPREFPLEDDGATNDLNRRLTAFVDRAKPDLIVLSHWADALPAALAGRANIVVDAHNIEPLLEEDLLRSRGGLTLAKRMQLWRFRRRHRHLFRSARRVWVPSEDDVRALRRLDPRLAAPFVWPNVVDVEEYADLRTGATPPPPGLAPNGRTLVYVGWYHYVPNARAAAALIERVFPRLAADFADARLVLVGRDPTDLMLAAADRDPRIIVTGGVADVRPYLRLADACAVPLTEGGGTRLKILEAFAAQIPVISTTKGAEGLGVEDGVQLIVADDDERFAAAAAAIFRNPIPALERASRAYTFVCERYSLGKLERLLPHALAPAQRNGREHAMSSNVQMTGLSDAQDARLEEALRGVEGWLGPVEARLLYSSVRDFPPIDEPLRAVEIGSWKGRSTIAMACALEQRIGEVVAIDPHDTASVDLVGEYGAVDTFAAFTDNIRRAGVANRIRVVRSTSTEAARDVLTRPVHVLFVDGSHRYEDVKSDVQLYFPALAGRSVVALNDPSRDGVYRALREFVLTRGDLFDGFIGENTIFFTRDVARLRTMHDRVAAVRLRGLLFLRYLGQRYDGVIPGWLRRMSSAFAYRITGYARMTRAGSR
ncbi:MAG: glycosyltransferase [Candidatus Eremiobacteraeota bacterium]|nr:glycosyltransferase [Candidatus Eremiobacteraeota bacterium]